MTTPGGAEGGALPRRPVGPTVLTTIERIAAGGAGVGRLPDGRVLFVQRTAPGDEVEVRVTHQKRAWARGTLVALRRRGPSRRPPPCIFYERCGGCTLEHIEYASQLDAKAAIVADALRRIGRLDVDAPEVIASPAEFRYRNRVSFTLWRLRSGRVIAGFHEIDAPGRLLDVTGACLLPEPGVAEAWDGIRAAWGPRAERLPAGPRLRLTLRGAANGRTALLIEGGRGRGRPRELLALAPSLESIWHRASPDGAVEHFAGEESVAERWLDEDIAVTGSVFLQVNRRAAALLEAYVVSLSGDVEGQRIIDAYCGVGLHARRLARAGARVIGIERDAEALREARRSSPPEVDYLEGDVETLLPSVLPADLVILNPPRAGLAAGVCAALVERPPARVIYVSCDPATLARDLARVESRLRIRSVRCYDLFPQTAHVETVAELACVTS